jgi:hypothetical protein
MFGLDFKGTNASITAHTIGRVPPIVKDLSGKKVSAKTKKNRDSPRIPIFSFMFADAV